MSRRLNESPTIRQYRELLGVSETASKDDLKKAYHQRAFLYHPDRNEDPTAIEQFQKVRKAYEFLVDPVQVATLKQNHLKERLFDNCIEGIQISFGAFFGHRVYVAGLTVIPKTRRIGSNNVAGPGVDTPAKEESTVYVEEDRSILDNQGYDSIEVVYAGRFSSEDEEHLVSGGKVTRHGQLPWVILNNKGILDFLDEKYDRALKCYEELNERIPNNIIFLYREALCLIILAFKNPERGLLGKRPAKRNIQKAVQLLRHCIKIGESRTVGKQKCLVIRKTLADVLEKVGQRRGSKKLWKEVSKLQPNSVEAQFKAGDSSRARDLLRSNKTSQTAKKNVNRSLLLNRGK